MHFAAPTGHANIVEILYLFGANLEVVDIGGFTPLMLAVWNCNVESARLLLSLNADTTKTDLNNRTVSQTNDKDIKQLLLKHLKKSVSVFWISFVVRKYFFFFSIRL